MSACYSTSRLRGEGCSNLRPRTLLILGRLFWLRNQRSMSEIGMFQQLRIAICRKHITARPKKLPLCGAVGDDKDDLGECSTILVFQKPVLVHGYRL